MKPLSRTAFLSIFSIAAGGAVLLLAASLVAQPSPSRKTQKLTASAIQIERTDPPEDLLVPEAFRVSTYENVIREVTKTNKFQHVYRSGDRTAAHVPDLVILHMIPEAFKEGSQKKREVTTVAGGTSIKMKVQFTSRDGRVLLEKDLEGKVRFFGENLRATYDIAKKVAAVVNDTF